MTKTIFLIDSDRDYAEFLARLFEVEGWKVIAADSPTEAIASLPKTGVDLVITEAFDQKDDFRFDPLYLEKIRELAGTAPIMLSSIYPSVSSVRRGQFGIADVLPKPYALEDMEHKVKRLLGEEAS